MAETLTSVGLDVGTTSTQLIVSRLSIENRASAFAVPELEITDRTVLYRSPVYFTPLLSDNLIDGPGIREIVEAEYKKAGIRREQVRTGAMIITGETSRKENAGTVLEALSEFAGDFVVAEAGPDLESRLAAQGSGAVEESGRTGKTVLHMDIGGGTSNLALIRSGEIVDTGCLNVGGRLVKFDKNRKISWISPALTGMTDLKPGDNLEESQAQDLAEQLTQILEMGAGLRKPDDRFYKLITREAKALDPELLTERPVLSFSGGVADCVDKMHPWQQFGDLGPCLGRAIRCSRLCTGPYLLGRETIRATVIGAGCYSAQLSGSTVFYQNVALPLKNLPAAVLREELPSPDSIRRILLRQEGDAVLAIPGLEAPSYQRLADLAEALIQGFGDRQILVCVQRDQAKALGQLLALHLGPRSRILCIDRIRLQEQCYLDVGKPVEAAVPVVVKTLILSSDRSGI